MNNSFMSYLNTNAVVRDETNNWAYESETQVLQDLLYRWNLRTIYDLTLFIYSYMVLTPNTNYNVQNSKKIGHHVTDHK